MELLNKIKQYSKYVLIGLVFVAMGIVAILGAKTGFSFGSIIDKILGKKFKKAKVSGNATGEVKAIKKKINPFRNKKIIELEDGEKIELPKGVLDKNVEKVLKLKTGYKVKVLHNKDIDL